MIGGALTDGNWQNGVQSDERHKDADVAAGRHDHAQWDVARHCTHTNQLRQEASPASKGDDEHQPPSEPDPMHTRCTHGKRTHTKTWPSHNASRRGYVTVAIVTASQQRYMRRANREPVRSAIRSEVLTMHRLHCGHSQCKQVHDPKGRELGCGNPGSVCTRRRCTRNVNLQEYNRHNTECYHRRRSKHTIGAHYTR